jgi:ethanolamine ammonia-lyase small subunit
VMSDQPLKPSRPSPPLDVDALRAHTPARVLVGRAGLAYRTATQLELRRDHAAAVDSVQAELDLTRDFGPLVEEMGLVLVQSCAASKEEYLLRPDLGRRLNEVAAALVRDRCPARPDLQVIVGDGLSARAVAVQAPPLLARLNVEAAALGWSVGPPFVVRYCRVGILNDIGAILEPTIAILLIGERPGLATAESLSAYLGYRPRPGHTDAQRNLVSNINSRGVGIDAAARRILALATKMRRLETSGFAVKEELPDDAMP